MAADQGQTRKQDWQGRRALIMGLGRHGGGAAAARYLALAGANVTVTDLTSDAALADSLASLADVPVARFKLGGHQESDFLAADLVVVNPAVKPDNGLVESARRNGALITSEIELFLNACPAPVVGVTGSSGKSTTAAMTAAILAATGRRTWLGGNIGVSLLPELDAIQADDRVVLELSSFQLFWLNETARWPQTVIVTNCAANHLDWHGTMPRYIAAKQRLVRHAATSGVVVFDPQEPGLAGWSELAGSRFLAPPPLERLPPLAVPGVHNCRNAACAAAAAVTLGADGQAVREGLMRFRGLSHRLSNVATVAGRTFVDDSKSTTPDAALAALEAIDGPIWMLLGGADKGSDFRALMLAVGERAKGAAVYGQAGGALDALLLAVAPELPRRHTATLDTALEWCWSQSSPGDTILLSPGCSSLDQFADYAARGARFAAWVARLASSISDVDVI